MEVKSINIKLAHDNIINILNNIRDKSPFPIIKTYNDDKNYESFTKAKKNGYLFVIGTRNWKNNLHNNEIPINNFVDTIISCYHEERHLQQAFFYQQDSCTPEIRNMAHTDILRATIPEYYRLDTGYYTNINEIDAELYGIRKTRAFLQTYFPEINSEKVMTELIQSYPHWYADNNITSVNEAIYNLEKAKEQAYNKPVLLPIRYTKNQKYSPNL